MIVVKTIEDKNRKKSERETRVYRRLDSIQGPNLVSHGYLHHLVQA